MNNPNSIVYNPYAAFNPRHLSSLALCWKGNSLAGCANFTPNTNIKTMSSNVYHGHSGSGVRFIPAANENAAAGETESVERLGASSCTFCYGKWRPGCC